jgi:hypothetical protein
MDIHVDINSLLLEPDPIPLKSLGETRAPRCRVVTALKEQDRLPPIPHHAAAW